MNMPRLQSCEFDLYSQDVKHWPCRRKTTRTAVTALLFVGFSFAHEHILQQPITIHAPCLPWITKALLLNVGSGVVRGLCGSNHRTRLQILRAGSSVSLPDNSDAQEPEMEAEGGRWNLTCQVCGGQDDLLGCDVSLYLLPVLGPLEKSYCSQGPPSLGMVIRGLQYHSRGVLLRKDALGCNLCPLRCDRTEAPEAHPTKALDASHLSHDSCGTLQAPECTVAEHVACAGLDERPEGPWYCTMHRNRPSVKRKRSSSARKSAEPQADALGTGVSLFGSVSQLLPDTSVLP